MQTLKPKIEEDVDAVRCTAVRVSALLEEVKGVKERSMSIDEEDEWIRYKTAKDIQQDAVRIMKDAEDAHNETSSRWRALADATSGHTDAPTAFAVRTAMRAYEQANGDINTIAKVVDEVKQDCMNACKFLYN